MPIISIFNENGYNKVGILAKSDGIRFDFKAKFLYGTKTEFKVSAILYNDNKDTAYFLSSSCDGEQYSLQYDSSKFYLAPRIFCNASFPRIYTISPYDKFDFIAYFKTKAKVNEIKLGFDFYQVSKQLKVNNTSKINIHNRTEIDKNIIWSGIHGVQ
jgi:hypothetical protein